MSLPLPTLSKRNAAIAARFGARAESYERHADLQRLVADRLALLLPAFPAPRILELGCGTGIFTNRLLARYPAGTFRVTDLSPAMVRQCRRNIASPSAGRLSFAVMDAARPEIGRFDLIAMSMTLHWLADPAACLERLRTMLAPDGVLVFATLGGESFAEWRDVLAAETLQSGLVPMPELPGIVDEDRLVVDENALAFLRRLQAIGGLTPRDGYVPLSPGELRRTIRAADARNAKVTWHIVYGRLTGLMT